MKKLLTVFLTILCFQGVGQIKISNLPTESSITDSTIFICVKSSITKKTYMVDLQDYLDFVNIWSKSGTDVYVTGVDVGIGTASPNYPLEVVGKMTCDSAVIDTLRFGNDNTIIIGDTIFVIGTDTLLFSKIIDDTDTINYSDTSAFAHNVDSANNNFVVNTDTIFGATDTLIITAIVGAWYKIGNYILQKDITDSVGIGLINPICKLEILGDFKNSYSNFTIENNASILGSMRGSGFTASNRYFNGVGINPTGDTISALGFYKNATNYNLIIAKQDTNRMIVKVNDVNLTAYNQTKDYIKLQMRYYNANVFNFMLDSTQLLLYNNQLASDSALLRITKEGNVYISDSVGIGTNAPAYKLDLAGDFNLTDKIYMNDRQIIYYPTVGGMKETILIGNRGSALIGGDYNTFVGMISGVGSNTIGYSNTFTGYNAGGLNSTGHENTFMGYDAGYSNVSGHYNTCIGALSGLFNTCSHNTFIGTGAGHDNISGYSNVFIGDSAGYSEMGSNKLYIENSDAGSLNALIYGEFDNDLLKLNSTVQIRDVITNNGDTILSYSGDSVYKIAASDLAVLTSYWEKAGNYVYPKSVTTDSVGINTMTPTELLDVVGNITATGFVNADDSLTGQWLTIGSRLGSVGTNSAVFGYECTASGDYSFASGFMSDASGNASFASGNRTVASGNTSFASGANNTSNNICSFASGSNNTSSGNASFVCGNDNIASGANSFASGYKTKAISSNSFASGGYTEANGSSSIAMNYIAKANASCSFAAGTYTLANSYLEAVFGRYNDITNSTTAGSWVATDNLFVIGNGNGLIGDPDSLNNALTIFKNGNIFTDTNLYIGDSLIVGGISEFIGNGSFNSNLTAGTITSDAGVTGVTGLFTENMTVEDTITIGDSTGGNRYSQYTEKRLWQGNNGGSIFIGEEAGAVDDLSGNKNVFVGDFSGMNNTNGYENLGIGFSSLKTMNHGIRNTAVGQLAMSSTEANNNSNTALGYRAGQSIGEDFNVFIGAYASYQNTNSFHSTYVGYNAGQSNNGSYNVMLGSCSGVQNGIHSYNVFIGDSSGYRNTGSHNIFVGYNSGNNETGSNKLYIENSNSAFPLIYGDFSTNELTINGNFFADTIGAFGNCITMSYLDSVGGCSPTIFKTGLKSVTNIASVTYGSDASVSDAELLYLDATSSIQTQLDARCLESVFGTAISNGLTLDGTDLKVSTGLQSLSGLTLTAGDIPIATGANAWNVLDAGATTEILVGGGTANPVWTTATGTGAPARADSPTFTTLITAPEIVTSSEFQWQISFTQTIPGGTVGTCYSYNYSYPTSSTGNNDSLILACNAIPTHIFGSDVVLDSIILYVYTDGNGDYIDKTLFQYADNDGTFTTAFQNGTDIGNGTSGNTSYNLMTAEVPTYTMLEGKTYYIVIDPTDHDTNKDIRFYGGTAYGHLR